MAKSSGGTKSSSSRSPKGLSSTGGGSYKEWSDVRYNDFEVTGFYGNEYDLSLTKGGAKVDIYVQEDADPSYKAVSVYASVDGAGQAKVYEAWVPKRMAVQRYVDEHMNEVVDSINRLKKNKK